MCGEEFLDSEQRSLIALEDRVTLLESRYASIREFMESRVKAMQEIRNAVRESVDLLRPPGSNGTSWPQRRVAVS